MQSKAKALSETSKVIKKIQSAKTEQELEEAKQQLEETKEILKDDMYYFQSCKYCNKYLGGSMDIVLPPGVDLDKNGDKYCKLCESKYCNKYPNEKICMENMDIKTKEVSKMLSSVSIKKATEDDNCKVCKKFGPILKDKEKLSKVTDKEQIKKVGRSCVECKKNSCVNVGENDDKEICDFVDDILKYYKEFLTQELSKK